MNLAVKELDAPMNPKKVTDVKQLLSKHFSPEWCNWEDLGFYRNFLPCGEDVPAQVGEDSYENANPMKRNVAVHSDALYIT